MARQHATPILLRGNPAEAQILRPLAQSVGTDGLLSEAYIQQLIFAHPSLLPIAEIDRQFLDARPVAMEFSTPAGPIDIFLITPSGLPVIVECKLWRNPEGRREVVGQILDYAKTLTRFSSSDVEREARRHLGQGSMLIDLVRSGGTEVDEIQFNDSLTQNLRRGRFLLLIIGDGIREGVEMIAEYLRQHAGLHFTLGLVEMPVFEAPDGSRFIAPRVIAHTKLIEHVVIALPDGLMVQDAVELAQAEEMAALDPMTADRLAFWNAYLAGLVLDDLEQPLPRAPKQGFIAIPLPSPDGEAWLTVYRDVSRKQVGIYLSCTKTSKSEEAVTRIFEQAADILHELGGTAKALPHNGKPSFSDLLPGVSLAPGLASRETAIIWLQRRTNDFVNALRPRLKATIADMEAEDR